MAGFLYAECYDYGNFENKVRMNALRRAEESAQADIRSDLRRRRRALGLTQAQAAQLLGMSRLSHVVLSRSLFGRETKLGRL